MKIVLIGGHLSPALALLEQLPQGWQVAFIGRKYTFEGDKAESLEYNAIKQKSISFYSLVTGRLQRKVTRHSIYSAAKLPIGYAQAIAILLRLRPDIVIGFGGYLSLPVCVAAKALRIPVIIHEQTMGAGMANKFIGKFAQVICISWPSSEKFFPPGKTMLIGNLIRREIILHLHDEKKAAGKGKTLFVTGGSAGSHFINELVSRSLPELLDSFNIIHQTGDAKEFNDFDKLEKLRSSLPEEKQKKYQIVKFVEPLQTVNLFQKADIVVSRAGMNTVMELLLLAKPCILIPLPHGQINEQQTNALYLQKAGLAEILLQEKATKDSLITLLNSMKGNLSRYRVMHNVDTTLHLHASEKMIDLIKTVYEKKQHQKSQS